MARFGGLLFGHYPCASSIFQEREAVALAFVLVAVVEDDVRVPDFIRDAYLHVIADAATSVLAIAALIGGKFWGAGWLDPVMGIAGVGLVAVWAYGLLRDSSKVLLDAEMNAPVVAEIREVIEASPVKARISELHVWRVGKGKYACIVSLVTSPDAGPEYFKQRLRIHEELVHITIEINALVE
ncbi:cation transporter [Variovorax sp. LjRoot130]|uniref:cation transporter n=1 Tax=Variovorax sp. LjRoot130 TaxID=3342261 RepID=UPI003ECF2643